MKNLEQITIEQARNLEMVNKEDVKSLKFGEPIFSISGKVRQAESATNELLELEIALRKCERVGVFRE